MRIGQMIRVKPEGKQAYIDWHANPLPGVNEMIKQCNIQNYSIYSRGDYLFSYFEYVGDDYEADMAKMDADEVTLRWWTFTKPCFEKFSIRPDAEFYADMKQIFYLE